MIIFQNEAFQGCGSFHADGSELVAVGQTRVTQVHQAQGLSVPKASQTVDETVTGLVEQNSVWNDIRVNEDLGDRAFSKD